MKTETTKLSTFLKGLIAENPVLVLVLGTCPTLAQTSSVINAISMGIATMIVLICSNAAISALRKIIPETVRIPCYIVIIAGFVTLIEFLLKCYLPTIYSALGIFLPLITVNCIILGRAEAFASKNKVVASALDGLGMGIGFTIALFAMGSIREILGAGSFMGMKIPVLCDNSMVMFIMPAGGFFVLGCIIALVNKLANKKPPAELGCSGCPHADSCKNVGACENKEATQGGAQ